MTKRIAIAAVLWIAALYIAQAGTLFFDGEAGSGGETKGYAQDISCSRNWWAFGALWSCEATIVANDGKRYHYSNGNSSLTPADVGKRVPMTNNRVRTTRTSAASVKWGVTEERPPSKGLLVLCLFGAPVAALFITFRLFRDRKADSGADERQRGGRRLTRYRKRRFAVAWFLSSLYAAIFVGAFWADHTDGGEAEATADNVECERNWMLLGTRWSCSAIVTDTDGKQYRYTNYSSMLSPADIGAEVPMEKFTYADGPPKFSPARGSFDPKPWNAIAGFALGIGAFAGAAFLWPPDRLGRPADPERRRALARSLRRQWRWNVPIGVLALYGAYFVHGVFVVAHINDDGTVVLPTQGSGTARSCDRDWRYLGVVWRCTVEVKPDFGSEVTQTMSQSQFTPGDIGEPKPVTLVRGSTWEAVDQPYESKFAVWAMIVLIAIGTVIAKPLSNLRIARDLENSRPEPDPLDGQFLEHRPPGVRP